MKKKYVIAYYGEITTTFFKGGGFQAISNDGIIFESESYDEFPSSMEIELNQPDKEYDYAKVEERYYPVTNVNILDNAIVLNELRRIRTLSDDGRDIDIDLRILTSNLETIQVDIFERKRGVAIINGDMWSECHESLEVILEDLGLRTNIEKSDFDTHKWAIEVDEKTEVEKFYYEINFYGQHHEYDWTFYVNTANKMKTKEIIHLLETKYLGADGLEQHHIDNIVSIHEMNKEEYESLNGTFHY